MAISNIEWTELTWNPTTGCSKVSAGCKNCYAEVLSRRLKAMGQEKYSLGFQVRTHERELATPFSWKGSKMVFVNSMSDLFHEEIPMEFIQKVFSVMRETPQHTYQILTKRSERLRAVSDLIDWPENVWMGVSVEDERVASRIDDLSHTGAHVKFLSVEPFIGLLKTLPLKYIDWVIVGGESGHKARVMKKEWIDVVLDECQKQNVKFFFKQWGKPKFNPDQTDPTISTKHPNHAKGGCLLDGMMWREFPTAKRSVFDVK